MDNLLKKHKSKLILILVFAICSIIYYFVPTVNEFINNIVKMIMTGDFEVVKNFVASYGPYAMVVSFFMMILQSVAAPLPAFLITFANAALFGWWQGAILSWSSAMVGAGVCFYIARILGRDTVEKLVTKQGLESVDSFFKEYGGKSIMIARLLPFISFDIVSYAAGLTSMSFRSFIIATGIGQLPATIVYSYVGGMLTGGARMVVTALLIVFALSILVVIIKQIYDKKKVKR